MNKSETCHESFYISLKFIEAKNNKITQNRNSNPQESNVVPEERKNERKVIQVKEEINFRGIIFTQIQL